MGEKRREKRKKRKLKKKNQTKKKKKPKQTNKQTRTLVLTSSRSFLFNLHVHLREFFLSFSLPFFLSVWSLTTKYPNKGLLHSLCNTKPSLSYCHLRIFSPLLVILDFFDWFVVLLYRRIE